MYPRMVGVVPRMVGVVPRRVGVVPRMVDGRCEPVANPRPPFPKGAPYKQKTAKSMCDELGPGETYMQQYVEEASPPPPLPGLGIRTELKGVCFSLFGVFLGHRQKENPTDFFFQPTKKNSNRQSPPPPPRA